MSKRYEVEIVRPREVRKGDKILNIGGSGSVYELEVVTAPEKLGDYALGCDMLWPDDPKPHGYSLGESGAWHLRLVAR